MPFKKITWNTIPKNAQLVELLYANGPSVKNVYSKFIDIYGQHNRKQIVE